ncbi:MarR family transcriptional regulator [Actinomyces sp. ZJ308]|uniref:MarR family winged helix-turn-helix transcriptional regulator n=1 Tax=Actinomyces sp. ZJ308 TaxID=2708342 RepID=UPI00141EC9C2|nr:MarR family transcriptional regulator [Actinomyces sp. ZJ308]
MSQDDPRELLGYQLKHVQAALRTRMDEALRPLGLSAPQYLCLELLSRAPGASTSDLAREAFVTRQTMSTLLRSLMDRGLAQRVEQAPSGRALPLRLTPEGRSLLKEASKVTLEIERIMVAPLSEAQLRMVQEALSACVAALEE